jgi:hypothetical protein
VCEDGYLHIAPEVFSRSPTSRHQPHGRVQLAATREATRWTEADVAIVASVARVEVGVDETALPISSTARWARAPKFQATFDY